MSSTPLTVVFLPESAYGPTNNCIGIGSVLRRQGHRVVFCSESSWRGRLAPLGFEEALVDLAPPAAVAAPSAEPAERDGNDSAGQFWKDFIRETAPEFRKPTIEQLETFMRPTWQALTDGARYAEARLVELLEELRPDVVIEDNVVCFPALLTCGAPFVRIVSCNPLEVPGPRVPPPYSGLPSDDDAGWAAFRAEYDRTHRPMWTDFAAWVRDRGGPALPDLCFMPPSERLNLYVYPELIDYTDRRPLDRTWQRLDSSVRTTDDAFALPARLADRPERSALVYLSLGSLGSADVELMRRLVAALEPTPHRYLVSTGPQHDAYELGANMWGAEFVPQTRILALVDLVLTHGGNNTTTEAFHFGKPMVVLPLFWDQHDNAQRVAETGFGARLDPYRCTPDELRGAIDRLLGDAALRDRLGRAGRQIRARDGVAAAARRIEAVGRGIVP